MAAFKELLQRSHLKPTSSWRKVSAKLEDDEAFQALDRLARLEVFQAHIRQLEEEEKQEKEREKEARRRKWVAFNSFGVPEGRVWHCRAWTCGAQLHGMALRKVPRATAAACWPAARPSNSQSMWLAIHHTSCRVFPTDGAHVTASDM